MLADHHLHTFVSDGDLDPAAVLQCAAERGVTHLSITDHDALGAYRWREGAVFEEAHRRGLVLSVGIEMDADMDGVEVHLLAFGLPLDHAGLNDHLESVGQARSARARQELDIVNELLGPGTITEEEIFVEGRETLMKPHFIHPLLDKRLFPTYEEANAWYKKNVKAEATVPKPPLSEAIRLLRKAGGTTALAHPGYYEKAGVDMVSRLPRLAAAGLQGIELDYPYHACSPHLFSREDEQAFRERMRAAALPLGLRLTRGSDCHTRADFDKVYGSASP